MVLTRNVGESIVVGDNVVIKVIEIRDGRVRLAVKAPDDVSVHRSEVADNIRANGGDASKSLARSKPHLKGGLGT